MANKYSSKNDATNKNREIELNVDVDIVKANKNECQKFLMPVNLLLMSDQKFCLIFHSVICAVCEG